MKKIIFAIPILFIQAMSYADDCFVIGFHQPGTEIYNGPTICKKVKIDNITVYGPLRVSDSVLNKKIEVSGPIDSENSTLGDITIKPQFTAQTITLKNTVVTGNIQFEGKPGVVVLTGGSKIQGSVVNGIIKPRFGS